MNFLDLTPVNITAEKEKFFSQGHQQYNPQFTYVVETNPNALSKYGALNEALVSHSYAMLERHPIEQMTEYASYSKQVLTEKIRIVTEKLGLPSLPIFFSHKYLSGFLLSNTGLHVKLPIALRDDDELLGKINHEVQTHYLRKHNSKQANLWTKNAVSCRFTEEGLANLHSFIESENQVLQKNYLNYIASYVAQQSSFFEVFSVLQRLGMQSELAWTQAVKIKRGITDTAKSGGSTLAKVYLEGSIQVGQWIGKNKPEKLFVARLSLEEIEQLSSTELENIGAKSILPTFFTSAKSYAEQIAQILEKNELTDFKLD